MRLSQISSCLLCGFLAASTDVFAGPLLTVEPSADKQGAVIKVSPENFGSTNLLEVVDAKTGNCVKVIYAGRFTNSEPFSVTRRSLPPQGDFRVRYREDIRLVFDKDISLPKQKKWINPTDVQFINGSLYVMDAGRLDPKPNSPSAETVPVGHANLYKFHGDESLDRGFGDRGCLTLCESPSYLRSFGVDEKGLVYFPNGTNVEVWDEDEDDPLHVIGGTDPEAPTKSTQNVGSIAVGPPPRIYIPSDNSTLLRVYDRSKKEMEGFLYTYTPIEVITAAQNRSVTTDGNGAVYFTDGLGQMLKFEDTGKEMRFRYISHVAPVIDCPLGPAISQGLLWVTGHGPSSGEIVLLWDTGAKLLTVGRFGTQGVAPGKTEFSNPSAVAATPDHLSLWVVEDGVKEADKPPGNARVRHFKITGEKTEEVPLPFGNASK